MTTVTYDAEDTGKELARLAINVNDFSGPTYRKYFDAFLTAARVAPAMFDGEWADDAAAAFDQEIQRLGAEHDLF